MGANTNPIFYAERKNWVLELDNADGTTPAALVAAGNNGSLIEAISVTSDDTAAVELEFFLNDGSNDYQLGSLTVAAGSGTDGGTNAAVDALNQTDLPWLRDDLSIALENGFTLKVGAYAAITAAKVVHIVAWGGDY